MPRHGENIRKRADGRWEGRYPIYSKQKGRKIYRSIYGRTYMEVKDKLALQKRNPDTQKEPEKRSISMTLEYAATEWFEEIKERRKQSTYIKYHFIYVHHIEQLFGTIELHRITNSLVREFLPASLSNSTRKSIYCVLNQILKFTSIQYSVSVGNLKAPSSSVRSKPIEVFSRKEQAELLLILYHETDIFKTAILLCLYTGLRLGEVCALKWSDIDLENRLLLVNRTVQRLYVEGYRTKTILLETPPKSEFSRREIPLSVSAIDLLIRFHHDKEYIFGGRKPMEPRTLQNHFKKIIRKVGLSNKNFHILRHTFATNCVEGGTDVKSLSEILGHSDVQITLNRYVHPSMDTKRKHLNALSVFYGQIYGQAG